MLLPAFNRNGISCPIFLLYADDILLSSKAGRANSKAIKHILDTYGRVSGPILNLVKSRVYFGKHAFVNNH